MPKKRKGKSKLQTDQKPFEDIESVEGECYNASFEYRQMEILSNFVNDTSPEVITVGKAPVGWCHSEDELPKTMIKGKTRFHKPRIKLAVCECRNRNCQCGPSPAMEAIEDEKEKEYKKSKLITKPTNASVLREASILLKEDQKQQQKILDLLSAPRSYLDYENFLDELKDIQEKEALVELEKKHLSGQLSYEEAILAKRRVIEDNAKKREDYLEYKAAIEEELEAFKETELAKVKEMVKDIHKQHEKAREMQAAVMKRRQKAAKSMNKDLKDMLRKKVKERETEIEKKIAAIKEFKILQQIKKEELNSKEAELSKLIGSSMEELKARLSVYKRRMREELTMKKSAIFKQKCRKEMLQTAATNFISEVKNCRKELKKLEHLSTVNTDTLTLGWSPKNQVPRAKVEIEDEQLTMLRVKLEEARMRRQSFQSKYIKTLST